MVVDTSCTSARRTASTRSMPLPARRLEVLRRSHRRPRPQRRQRRRRRRHTEPRCRGASGGNPDAVAGGRDAGRGQGPGGGFGRGRGGGRRHGGHGAARSGTGRAATVSGPVSIRRRRQASRLSTRRPGRSSPALDRTASCPRCTPRLRQRTIHVLMTQGDPSREKAHRQGLGRRHRQAPVDVLSEGAARRSQPRHLA